MNGLKLGQSCFSFLVNINMDNIYTHYQLWFVADDILLLFILYTPHAFHNSSLQGEKKVVLSCCGLIRGGGKLCSTLLKDKMRQVCLSFYALFVHDSIVGCLRDPDGWKWFMRKDNSGKKKEKLNRSNVVMLFFSRRSKHSNSR